MSEHFERAVAFVLRHEGGYTNDNRDPGGETKFGISKRAYPHLDIKGLTEAEARAIYRRDYWEKAGCGLLEWPMSLVVFDTAVNCGVKKAVELWDRTFNWTDYLFLRLELYSVLAGGSIQRAAFLRGWINRCIDLWRTVKASEHPLSLDGGEGELR